MVDEADAMLTLPILTAPRIGADTRADIDSEQLVSGVSRLIKLISTHA